MIECFVTKERIPELLSFLQEAVYDESSLTPSTKPQYLQDVLFKCFIHQVGIDLYTVYELINVIIMALNLKP